MSECTLNNREIEKTKLEIQFNFYFKKIELLKEAYTLIGKGKIRSKKYTEIREDLITILQMLKN